jgi:hypothetical protein
VLRLKGSDTVYPRTLPVTMVGGYGFTGPLALQDAIETFALWSGVYVIARAGDAVVLDIGQSGEIGDRLSNHPRRPCWNIGRFGQNLLAHAHIENDLVTRLLIEQELRAAYTPACGER